MEYASPEDVPTLMARWLHFFNEQRVMRDKAPSVYTRLHIPFVHIHPFADGNRRLATLISNLPLLRAGLPPNHYSQGMEAGIYHAPCRTLAGTWDTCFRLGTCGHHSRSTEI